MDSFWRPAARCTRSCDDVIFGNLIGERPYYRRGPRCTALHFRRAFSVSHADAICALRTHDRKVYSHSDAHNLPFTFDPFTLTVIASAEIFLRKHGYSWIHFSSESEQRLQKKIQSISSCDWFPVVNSERLRWFRFICVTRAVCNFSWSYFSFASCMWYDVVNRIHRKRSI